MDLRWNDARMPNGRPHLPGLYVRSQESPALVVHEREEWLTAWKFARASSRGARSSRSGGVSGWCTTGSAADDWLVARRPSVR